MPDAPTFLRITDVSKRYGDRLVLRDVDLEVAQGQTVALIGPSGGKSSLLRCINGLQPIETAARFAARFEPRQRRRLPAITGRMGGLASSIQTRPPQTRLAAKLLPSYS